MNPSEADAVEQMLLRGYVRQDQFGSVTGKNDPRKFIHRLRVKLKHHGIEVDAQGGVRGAKSVYHLGSAAKARLRQMCD